MDKGQSELAALKEEVERLRAQNQRKIAQIHRLQCQLDEEISTKELLKKKLDRYYYHLEYECMGTKNSVSEPVGNTNGLQTQTAVRDTSVSDSLPPDTGLVEKDVDVQMQSAEAIASPTELVRPARLERTPATDGTASEPLSVKVKKETIDLGLIDLCDDDSDIQEPVQIQNAGEEVPRETTSNKEVTMSTNGTVPKTPSSVAPLEQFSGDILEGDSQLGGSGEEYDDEEYDEEEYDEERHDEDELDNSPNDSEGKTCTVLHTEEQQTSAVSPEKRLPDRAESATVPNSSDGQCSASSIREASRNTDEKTDGKTLGIPTPTTSSACREHQDTCISDTKEDVGEAEQSETSLRQQNRDDQPKKSSNPEKDHTKESRTSSSSPEKPSGIDFARIPIPSIANEWDKVVALNPIKRHYFDMLCLQYPTLKFLPSDLIQMGDILPVKALGIRYKGASVSTTISYDPGLFCALALPNIFFTDVPKHEVLLISKCGGKYHAMGLYKFILSPEPLSPEGVTYIMKVHEEFMRNMIYGALQIPGVPEAILYRKILFLNQIPAFSIWVKTTLSQDDLGLAEVIELESLSMPAPPMSTLANSKKRGRHQRSASEPCDESNGSDGTDDETLETPSHKQRRLEN
ncbi:hypothetical protein ACEPAG_5848 [Sanghuangporus baumii]